jgi:hypothetical protein
MLRGCVPQLRTSRPSEMSDVNEGFEVDNRKKLHFNPDGIPTGSMALCLLSQKILLLLRKS